MEENWSRTIREMNKLKRKKYNKKDSKFYLPWRTLYFFFHHLPLFHAFDLFLFEIRDYNEE